MPQIAVWICGITLTLNVMFTVEGKQRLLIAIPIAMGKQSKEKIMKKVWKGLAATAAAVGLAATGFIGTTSAFAADGVPLGVTATDNALTDAYKFTAYKLMDATNTGTDTDPTYAYSFPSDGMKAAVVAAFNGLGLKDADGKAITVATTDYDSVIAKAIETNIADDSATARAFADALALSKALGSGTELVGSTTADVDEGYYLIVQTDGPGEKENAPNGKNYTFSRAMLTSVLATNDSNTVTVKRSEVTMTKAVLDDAADNWDEATEGWFTDADYTIGETIPFKLTGTLPENINEFQTFFYEFGDHCDDTLDIDNGSAKVYLKKGDNVTQLTTGFTATYETHKLSITFANLMTQYEGKYLNGEDAWDYERDSFIVTYTAKLNESAKTDGISTATPGVAHENYAKVTFSTDPYSNTGGKTRETPEDKAVVFA
ncbi:MAG: isopeptide-forming domain-containing fimbrial protein [Bifidobacteriaceae bacterium]|nr:isopeptide-forming domain-containing fimbrial protein [Bifidobacteriaceae bacterium]